MNPTDTHTTNEDAPAAEVTPGAGAVLLRALADAAAEREADAAAEAALENAGNVIDLLRRSGQ